MWEEEWKKNINHNSAYFSAAQTIGDFYVRPITGWLKLRSV